MEALIQEFFKRLSHARLIEIDREVADETIKVLETTNSLVLRGLAKRLENHDTLIITIKD